MPTGHTGRKHVSELIKATGMFEQESAVNYFYATVDVTGAAAVDPIGTPLVWNATTDTFEPLAAQDTTLITEDSTLPTGSIFCVTVGAKEGVGFNKQDVTLSATATKMTVIYRGPAGISEEGVTWGAATAGNQAIIKKALEKEGITVVPTAESVDPTHV